MRILLVEDNSRLSSIISQALRGQAFTVDLAHTVEDARAALRAARYDAMILDLGLPDADGITLIDEHQASRIDIPTLVLTAREGTRSLIHSLNSGADDYLRKPFEMEELIARLRALLRRPGSALGVILRQGNVVYDTSHSEVQVNGLTIEFSKRELSALELLMRRSGRVVSKADLEESLYGFGEEVGSNAIEVLIHRLRRKLAKTEARIEIHTLRGIGYLASETAE